MAAETDTDQARARKVAELLDAALPEFARGGLEGARVDAIAGAAGMNKRLLYHYVGDKAALFDAVLNLAYDRILKSAEADNGHEWRLVCHGAACGRTDRLAELSALGGSGATGAATLGLRLLAGLLPGLADQMMGNPSGDPAVRQRALSDALENLQNRAQNPAAKPRLKLRPELRKGSSTS